MSYTHKDVHEGRPVSEHVSVDLGAGGIVCGQPEHVARAVQIWQSMQDEERDWIRDLRARGVKAAHPDDGWVKRDENTVHLEYPQFGSVRTLEIGDLIALGSPDRSFLRPRPTRLVRVIDFSTGGFLSKGIVSDWDRYYVHFEEIS